MEQQELQVTYQSKRKPRVRQAEALEKIAGKRAFAVLMGLRTGKTKVVVDDFGRMVADGSVADLLVVAPGGAYIPWRDAVLADLPDAIVRGAMIFTWVSRRAKTKVFQAERDKFLSHAGPRVLIVNVEAISAVQAARDLVVGFLQQRQRRNVFVVDESVTIKSPDSRCGTFCVEVAPLAWYRRIMSGLVSPRSPLDLWNQFRFLDPRILGFSNFVAFRSRYAKVKQVCMLPNRVIRAKFQRATGFGQQLTPAELQRKVLAVDPSANPSGMSPEKMRQFLATMVEVMPRDEAIEATLRLGHYIQTVPVIDGYENVEELRDKIAPYSYRARLEDCYDMPPSDYSFRDVEMTDEQRRLYAEIKENATAQLRSLDHVTATHVIVQMLRLHQVLCGHVRDEGGKLHEIPEKRTAAIVEFLADYDGKATIWCSYDHDVRRVSEALRREFGDDSVARFWGGNVASREEEEVKFKLDPGCRFEVATPDAGKYGRDWSVANLVIYHSSKNNLDHRQQSEDRVKADGKTTPIAYVDFRVRGTVEDKIVRCLRDKIDMAAVINGDEWREWLV